jgi:hypothetical protein
MRYNGSKYGNSEWSNTIVIDTLDIESKVTLYTSDTGTISIFKTIEIGGFIYGVGGAGPITKRQPIIIKLDSDLNIITYKILPLVTASQIFYEIQYYNNNLYVCGNASNLYKLDLNLNFIDQVSVSSNISRFFSLTILNGFIYTIGSGMDGTNGVVYLSKFDMAFNLIKTISLGILASVGYYQYVDNNGTDLFLSYTLYDTVNQKNYFVLSKMDNNLNPIKRVYYTSSGMGEIRGIKVINNEVYCICVSANSFYILKHDLNFNLIKSTRIANVGYYLDTIISFNDMLIVSGFGGITGSPLFIFDMNLNKINFFIFNNLDNTAYSEVGRCFGNYKNKSLMYCGGVQTTSTTLKGFVSLLDLSENWLYSSSSLEITNYLDNNIIISTVGENIVQYTENSTIKNMGTLATSKSIPAEFVNSNFTKEEFII